MCWKGITISIGVATFPDNSRDPIELVELADTALYRAKRQGRNRVCTYRPVDEEAAKDELPSRRD